VKRTTPIGRQNSKGAIPATRITLRGTSFGDWKSTEKGKT
jgi:hypothetical protein